jgi:hypothetical protein
MAFRLGYPLVPTSVAGRRRVLTLCLRANTGLSDSPMTPANPCSPTLARWWTRTNIQRGALHNADSLCQSTPWALDRAVNQSRMVGERSALVATGP